MSLGVLLWLSEVALAGAALPSAGESGLQEIQAPGQNTILFIENVGQFDTGARFQVRGGMGTMWLADDAIWITVLEKPSSPQPPSPNLGEGGDGLPSPRFGRGAGGEGRGVNLKLSFPGANPHPRIEPFDRLDTVVSYFIGNDPAKWQPNVPVWGGVRYVDLYPGIDLEITGEESRWAWRLVVREQTLSLAPSPSQGEGWGGGVRLRVEGADAIELLPPPDPSATPSASSGLRLRAGVGRGAGGEGLRLTTAIGEFTLPLLTVEGLHVERANVERVNVRVFDVTPPSSSAPALPGPSAQTAGTSDLLYSTFLGGNGDDRGVAIAVDGAGSAYVTGWTWSSDFPTTPGSFDTSSNNGDVFVVKLNAGGTGLAYATFLGGSGDDHGYAIAVDGVGSAYVTGGTWSSDFPTTPGAFDTSYHGAYDTFMVNLNAGGTGLAYATFLGGSAEDYGQALAVDGAGSAYVTGYTSSSDFPTTPGAFDTSYDGYDAFVVKLNAGGAGLVYATFLGGSDSDRGYAIAVDGAGNAYVTGYTYSSDFPTTPGAFDTSHNVGNDAFVVKLNAEGTGLAYATFLGGNADDYGSSIAVDGAGSAYVTGFTYSSDFPATPGAFDTGYNGWGDAFMVKLNAGGAGLAYATFLGGNTYDEGNAIAVDGAGSAYVTGGTWSSDFPTTPGAFDTSYNGGEDACVVKLNAGGTGLAYATFLGGSGENNGRAIAVDGAGSAYVTGYTYSSDFPTTPSAFDTSHNGGGDAFVAKLAVGGRVFLTPPAQMNQGGRGQVVAYKEMLINATGGPDSFNLTLGSHVWDTGLSDSMIGPVADGETATFTVYVAVPLDAAWYSTDVVTVTATSVTSPTVYSGTATLTTQAYVPPSISVSPDVLTTTQDVNQIVTKPLTISNGDGVTLTFSILTGSPGGNTLEGILDSLNSNYQAMINVIPNRYDFSEGEMGTGIGDGGNDMYDGGNYLSTNLGGAIEYSNNTIVQSTYFGVNGRYFTRKYPGLFVLVADMEGVDYFQISGSLGADGSGNADGTILQTELHGVTYHGLVKRVYNAGDPSVNHLVIVPDNPAADHTFSMNTNEDYHQVYNLSQNTRLYYLLYAGTNGYYIDDSTTLNIMQTFLDALRLLPPSPWLSASPVSGTVPTYSSVPVQVTFDATDIQPGDHTTEIVVQSNDPITPSVSVPVTMTVLPTANMGRVTGAVSDAWTGQPLTATVELVGVYSMTASPDYTIWAPAGTYSLTAYTTGYYTTTRSVAITAGGVVTQNLALEPAQPRLEWAPAAVTARAVEGSKVAQTLTILNTGPLPLNVALYEINPAVAMQALSSTDLAGRRILYDLAHGEPRSSEYSSLVSDLTNAGAVVIENWYFPIDAVVLEGYDVLWVNCCGGITWGLSELNAVKDWLGKGGAVLVQGESNAATNDPARIFGIHYFSASCTSGTTRNIVEHPISEGVSAVNVEWTCWRLAPSSKAVIVVFDPQGQPHVVAQEQNGGKMVVVASEDFINWYLDYDDNRLLANNIFAWLARPAYSDVPWLSETPVGGTISGHSSLPVTLKFDATTLSPGEYQATLAIEHNDPAQSSPVELPVTLVVSRPKVFLPLIFKNTAGTNASAISRN
jgi:hypothetical protein